MPLLFIRLIDGLCEAADEGREYRDVQDALAAGVKAAAEIAAAEIGGADDAIAIEVYVEGAEGEAVARSIVSLSVTATSCNGG